MSREGQGVPKHPTNISRGQGVKQHPTNCTVKGARMYSRGSKDVQ